MLVNLAFIYLFLGLAILLLIAGVVTLITKPSRAEREKEARRRAAAREQEARERSREAWERTQREVRDIRRRWEREEARAAMENLERERRGRADSSILGQDAEHLRATDAADGRD